MKKQNNNCIERIKKLKSKKYMFICIPLIFEMLFIYKYFYIN